MNQDNGTPRPVRRPPNTSGSLLIIVIIVFMMLSGSDDTRRATQEDIRDSLQSLKDEHSNYTAWINGSQTNFTLNEETPAFHNLIGAFQHLLPAPPIVTAGYYNNITGSYKAQNLVFHNISDPPGQASWAGLAQTLYNGKNFTKVHDRAEGWNWTQSLEASMSIFSYRSSFSPENSTNFQRFRGYMEIEPPNPNKGFMDNPSLTLRMEGVYLPNNGKIVALVEPKPIMPDIRHLVALVPPQFQNVTANTVAAQLFEKIEEMEKELSAGTISMETEEPAVLCSFTLHGEMEAIHFPQVLIDEYERELRSPSGVPMKRVPPPRFNGVLVSKECGVLVEMETVVGKTSLIIRHRTIFYAAITAIVYYILIQLSLSVNDQWRTATSLLQGSRGVMATWLIADSYAAISHLMAAVFTRDGRLALLVPGFLGCILLIIDLRLLTLLNSVQFVLNQVEPVQPAVPSVNPTTSDVPVAQAGPDTTTTPETTTNQQSQQRTVFSLLASLLSLAFANDFRAWLMINALFSMFCMITLGLPLFGVWFLLVSSTWCAQITRNIYQRTRRAIRHDTVILSSIVRLFSPLYLFACPDNLLDIQPASWVWIIPVWVTAQVLLLIGQDYLGPLWFLPNPTSGPAYDYHPDLTKSDEEAVGAKLGDCTICMESIPADQGYVPLQSSGWLQFCWREVTKRRRVYALAPCGHNFHTTCLEQWMEIKSICPQCRRALPPL